MAKRGPKPPAERDERKALFLLNFAKCGIITSACEAAGITRETITTWRNNDPSFAEGFLEARARADDAIRQEIWDRAVTGTTLKKTVIHYLEREVKDDDGNSTGERERIEVKREETETLEKSDVLLIFLAKSRMFEYRERGDLYDEVRRIAIREGIDPDEAVAHAQRQLASGL